MKKKIISLSLIALLLLNTIIFADNSVKTKILLVDVSEDNWAYPAIVYTMEKNYFKGIGNNMFAPKMKVTRSQFLTVLSRIANIDKSKYAKIEFSDVKADTWYTAAANWAKQNKLMRFGAENKFEPNKTLTREEMAYIIDKFIQLTKLELSDAKLRDFKDNNKISKWAKDSVDNVVKKGVLVGSDGKFNPQGEMSRAEFAQVLYSIYSKKEQQTIQNNQTDCKNEQLLGEEKNKAKQSISDFSLDVLKQASKANKENDKNILISGLSIMPALSMTQNGAEGNTLQQMNTVLGLDNCLANKYFDNYKSQLDAEAEKKMYMANSIWIKEADDYTVKSSFIDINKKYYDTKIEQLQFDKQALDKINGWVKANTNNMIDKLIDKISGDAIMYLVNAIYFESEWQNNYTPRSVTDKKFTLENGTEQDAKMMYSVEKYYLEDKDTLGVIKPYKGGKYQFIAIMPNKGIKMKDYLNSLTAEKIDSLLKNKHEADVYTTLPQFETEYDIELSAVLKALGMTDAFNPLKANFQSLASVQSAEEKIIISRVLHKTKLTLDEKGTKAAAATAVEMTKTTAMPPMYEKEKKEVNLNRPFVYMIYDSKNQVPVFIGTLMSIK